MQLVFATNNKNKVKEVAAILNQNIGILSLEEINCKEEIPETSATIEGNAIQKAKYVFEKYGYNCFADDTGLEVEALEGRPGVYSARYAGEGKDSEDNMNKLLNELEGKENRKARFITVVSLIIGGEIHTFQGLVNGEITQKKEGEEGFGYDPVFKPEGYPLTFAQMPAEVKNEISHRALAINKMVVYLNSIVE
ncbi:MAG: non-canonical purine NTP diphosphatase [Bacteroidetes bacterium]|nr:non-canonical purine NTP diphosphatase [Bacteroidota bacterium]HET6244008.1 non-canonical purine NTP diphosphatase [Bacteroidia bacterium]